MQADSRACVPQVSMLTNYPEFTRRTQLPLRTVDGRPISLSTVLSSSLAPVWQDAPKQVFGDIAADRRDRPQEGLARGFCGHLHERT